MSEIPQVEDSGGIFLENGKPTDPFVLLRDCGWNFVRFRVWNHPTDGYCDEAHTLAMAKRAAKLGFKISIDFHYSDWWADPQKQPKPAAWKQLSFPDLAKAVHDYTLEVVSALEQQGTPPTMVQVGNEITAGMLWPDGKLDGDDPGQWKKLATLLKAGMQAVRDAPGGSKILTMIHLDRGADNEGATYWFDHAKKLGVPFDTIGLSYYPFWHGTLDQLRFNLAALSRRYRRDVYVVETGYPWTLDVAGRGSERVFADPKKLLDGFSATPQGQAMYLGKLERLIRQVPGGRGKGLLYWAPTWITAPRSRSPYDNLALFDYHGNALPSVAAIGGSK